MILRLAWAYGAVQALLAAVALGLVGTVLGQHIIGLTRQPLPLSWPLGVLLVAVVQTPLRDMFVPVEQMAARAALARALRATFCLLLVCGSLVLDSIVGADAALRTFVLLLVSIGFGASALSRLDPWVCTLGVGMGWVGLQFATPLGQHMVSILDAVGLEASAATVALTAVLYVNARGSA